MAYKHVLLALLVVLVWGCNFIFIKLGVDQIPPFFLCAMRFFFVSIPMIIFIKPPAASFRVVMLYGLVMFALQFSFLFLGIKVGIMPGLASLLLQVQVFFSILFAALFLKEIPHLMQIIGAALAFFGIALIAMHLHGSVTSWGFLLVIGAAMWYGLGNFVTKQLQHVNMMALIAWGSFIAFFPLLACSLLFEGPQKIESCLHHMTWLEVISVAYIVYISTWVGYGLWNKLISQYPLATVVPFTLLVPVVGLISASLILHEPLNPWEIIAGLLVITGLCINLLSARGRIKYTEKVLS